MWIPMHLTGLRRQSWSRRPTTRLRLMSADGPTPQRYDFSLTDQTSNGGTHVLAGEAQDVGRRNDLSLFKEDRLMPQASPVCLVISAGGISVIVRGTGGVPGEPQMDLSRRGRLAQTAWPRRPSCGRTCRVRYGSNTVPRKATCKRFSWVGELPLWGKPAGHCRHRLRGGPWRLPLIVSRPLTWYVKRRCQAAPRASTCGTCIPQ